MVEFEKGSCPNCGTDARLVTLYANNTCSHCGAPPDNSEMEIKRNVFVCPNCGAGNVNYEAIFPGGTCSNCGAPPGEVGIMASAEKVRAAGEFGLVLFAGDAASFGAELESMLDAAGVTHINVEDLILREVDVALRERAMEYFVEKATRVFIIVSPGLDKDQFLEKLLEYTGYHDKSFPIDVGLGGIDTQAYYPVKKFNRVDWDDREMIQKGIDHYFSG